jgi:pimeloyl-ACP methyl ester carboxylesterase
MAGYAAAFADALAALEITGPVDLYGFHTGTLLAIELALALPGQIRRMALTGIPMYPSEDRARKLAEAENFPAPDAEGTVILSLLEKLWTYVVGGRAAGVPLERAVRHFADKAYILDRFTWAYRGVWSWDFTRLAKLDLPVLLLQPFETLRSRAGRGPPHPRLRGSGAS